METFLSAAKAANPKEAFAAWTASDPEVATVRQLRELRQCEDCHRMTERGLLIELAPKAKRGTSGRYIHGYCYAVRHGLKAFKNLPLDGGLSQVTLNEFLALGLAAGKGRAVIDRAKNRRGVILVETHCQAGNCTERVREPESVLGRECYRKATTTNDKGRPVCAWHVQGVIFRAREAI